MAAAVVVGMRTGSDRPQQPDEAIQRDVVAIIRGLQERIRALELQLLQNRVDGAQDAQAYEDRLFALAQAKEDLARQLAQAEERLAEREAEVAELNRGRAQDREQIQAGLAEIAHMQPQLNEERALVVQMRAALEAATAQIERLTARQARLEEMHRETLAALQAQPQQSQSTDLGARIFSALGKIWDKSALGTLLR